MNHIHAVTWVERGLTHIELFESIRHATDFCDAIRSGVVAPAQTVLEVHPRAERFDGLQQDIFATGQKGRIEETPKKYPVTITTQDLQRAYNRVKNQTWPATFAEAFNDPLHHALLELHVRHSIAAFMRVKKSVRFNRAK